MSSELKGAVIAVLEEGCAIDVKSFGEVLGGYPPIFASHGECGGLLP
jgi:hypothetical protein